MYRLVSEYDVFSGVGSFEEVEKKKKVLRARCCVVYIE